MTLTLPLTLLLNLTTITLTPNPTIILTPNPTLTLTPIGVFHPQSAATPEIIETTSNLTLLSLYCGLTNTNIDLSFKTINKNLKNLEGNNLKESKINIRKKSFTNNENSNPNPNPLCIKEDDRWLTNSFFISLSKKKLDILQTLSSPKPSAQPSIFHSSFPTSYFPSTSSSSSPSHSLFPSPQSFSNPNPNTSHGQNRNDYNLLFNPNSIPSPNPNPNIYKNNQTLNLNSLIVSKEVYCEIYDPYRDLSCQKISGGQIPEKGQNYRGGRDPKGNYEQVAEASYALWKVRITLDAKPLP
jgi:hypothetical protein